MNTINAQEPRRKTFSASNPLNGFTTIRQDLPCEAVIFEHATDVHGLLAHDFLPNTFPQHVSIADSVRDTALLAASGLPAQLHRSVVELANLALNWDGEGAEPVKPYVLADIVETVKRLIQRAGVLCDPYLVPTFDGFVQIEWHGGIRSLDIEAVEAGWIAVGTWTDSENKHNYEMSAFERNDFDQLWKCYEWCVRNEMLWPSR